MLYSTMNNSMIDGRQNPFNALSLGLSVDFFNHTDVHYLNAYAAFVIRWCLLNIIRGLFTSLHSRLGFLYTLDYFEIQVRRTL